MHVRPPPPAAVENGPTMMLVEPLADALARVRAAQSARFFKLLVIADVERRLPPADLLGELREAGLDELVERFASLAARMVELRAAMLREEN